MHCQSIHWLFVTMSKYSDVQQQALTTICRSPKKEVIFNMKLHFLIMKHTSGLYVVKVH